MSRPGFLGIYVFASDLAATLAFYRALGLAIEEVGPSFARGRLLDGPGIEFGSAELTRSYDPGWQPPSGPGHVTINFELASTEAVDATYQKLTAVGHPGHLAPCDALWGARFAIVDDPDGNPVGLHSPRDREADRKRERAGA